MKDNCFIDFFYFLSNFNMNQPYVLVGNPDKDTKRWNLEESEEGKERMCDD